VEFVLEIEATGKYISTGRIFQRPSLTPWASLSVIGTGFWHSIEWVLKGLFENDAYYKIDRLNVFL